MDRWERVNRRLLGSGLRAETFVTAGRGDGARLAKQAVLDGFETVVAVGGDGTVHEVVNGIGIEGLERVRLGVVPAGTGGDFARNANLPRSVTRTAAALAGGRVRRIDVGVSEAEDRRLFVNFAETGLGAAVVAREARFGEAWPGRVSFFLAALGAASSESNARATIEVDGENLYSGPLVSAVVANGRYFAGGMKVAPRAAIADGELDVLILGDFTRAQLVGQIWKIYPGIHVSHPKVLFVRGKRVFIRPDVPTLLDLDGELYGAGPYSFSILPRALRVLSYLP